MIFAYAIEHYIEKNQVFKEIFKEIENHHQKMIIGVMKGLNMQRQEIVEGYLSLIKY
jgi:predicted neutral ceramidase superfamily lipid hydrolase